MTNKTMMITLPGGGILAAAGLPGSKEEDYPASPKEHVRVLAAYGLSMIDDGIAERVVPKAKDASPANPAPGKTAPGKAAPGKKAKGADKGETKPVPPSTGAPGDSGAGEPASSTTDTAGGAAVLGEGSSTSQADQSTDPEAVTSTSEQGQV